MVRPVEHGYITSNFGERTLGGVVQFHKGIDIGCKEPSPHVVFAFNGIVVRKGESSTFGNRVWQRITGGPYHNLYCVYAHLDSIDPSVSEGTVVTEGDPVGIMGNTGISHGKHLHFEIRTSPDVNGSSINPKIVAELYK